MENIFTEEISNRGRQRELDIAKGLAIIFMIWVHVNEVYQSTSIDGGLHNRIIEFIGSPPAAPVFMMLLGVGIIYSRRTTAEMLFKRGVFLVVLGYVLNLFRDFIPYYLVSIQKNDPSYIEVGWDLLWGTDILPFAGLAFIFFAIVKKLNLKNMTVFIIWCVFATLNLLVRGVSFDNSVLNGALRLLWGTDENAWFPFLTWITFPILGYFFGQLLIKCKNKDLFYKNILLVTGPISIPLWISSYVNDIRFGAFGELYQTEYYQHEIMGAIVLCVFALFWISLCYFVGKYMPEIIQNALARWSKNINIMYCVHWLLIGYLLLVLEELAYMPLGIFIIFIGVFVATDIICIGINKIKKNKRKVNIEKAA